MGSYIRLVVTLTAIAAAASFGLSAVYNATHEITAEYKRLETENARIEVLPSEGGEFFVATVTDSVLDHVSTPATMAITSTVASRASNDKKRSSRQSPTASNARTGLETSSSWRSFRPLRNDRSSGDDSVGTPRRRSARNREHARRKDVS